MKYLAPALVIFSMACFTDPQGILGIWIERNQVVAVVHAADCAPGAATKIVTLSGSLCVKETPAQVLNRLDQK